MYEIQFYEDRNGNSEILDYINELKNKADSNKEARIYYHKIIAYLDLIEDMGTRVGEPVTKHIDGQIWELRPLKNRILYAYYKNNQFIILHYFVKKTNKTPRREIEKAKRNLQDIMEREGL